MLKRSSNRNKLGVFNPKTQNYLIQPLYDEISKTPNGFLAHNFDSNEIDIYDCNGNGLLKTKHNQKPLLLANNLILFTSEDAQHCMIWNCNKKDYLLKRPFDSILFFVGSSTVSTEYSSNIDIEKIQQNREYLSHGACFDTHICVSYKKHWGVIDSKNGQIIYQFKADKAIQQKGQDIILESGDRIIYVKQNGETIVL